jgi:hypothetical protein
MKTICGLLSRESSGARNLTPLSEHDHVEGLENDLGIKSE